MRTGPDDKRKSNKWGKAYAAHFAGKRAKEWTKKVRSQGLEVAGAGVPDVGPIDVAIRDVEAPNQADRDPIRSSTR